MTLLFRCLLQVKSFNWFPGHSMIWLLLKSAASIVSALPRKNCFPQIPQFLYSLNYVKISYLQVMPVLHPGFETPPYTSPPRPHLSSWFLHILRPRHKRCLHSILSCAPIAPFITHTIEHHYLICLSDYFIPQALHPVKAKAVFCYYHGA